MLKKINFCLSILIVTCADNHLNSELSLRLKDVLAKFAVAKQLKNGMREFITENLSPQASNVKFILLWFKVAHKVKPHFETGQHIFKKRGCLIDTCFVTTNASFLRSVKEYDAIIFQGPDLFRTYISVPKSRSPDQKFIFTTIEPANAHLITSWKFRSFFNWTMTYKLSSDIYYGYITIMNNENEMIGPRPVMNWMSLSTMAPITDSVKAKLKHKRIAAAWLVTNCAKTRQKFVQKIKKTMKTRGLRLDILGTCGNVKCSGNKNIDCLKRIENDYYFYFAFEEIHSTDYVTKQLLYALQHYAVPVVYGGANYTRFMPEGTYLDAKKLGAASLVRRMVELIKDQSKYYDYFRWRNHYSYHDMNTLPEYDYYCQLCQKLHYETGTKWGSSIQDIKYWWLNDV